MTEAAAKNFGILIAYVLPGFGVLWALQPYSSTLRLWFSTSPTLPAGLEAVVFVTAASIAMGMTLSALRWLLVDSTMVAVGVERPQWDDAQFGARREAFEALVDAHFRHYQFYAHTALVLPLFAATYVATNDFPAPALIALLLVSGECVFLAAAHDSLLKYYTRTSRLLGSNYPTGNIAMTNGHHKRAPAKPAADKKSTAPAKPADKPEKSAGEAK